MTDQIMSKEHTRQRARRAFAEGKGRDDHGMNWHAAAVPVWQGEWDRCAAEARAAAHQLEPVAA